MTQPKRLNTDASLRDEDIVQTTNRNGSESYSGMATKSGKTQFASYVFIYHPILYAYQHPDQLRLKILYYPQEETQEQVMAKFMSYVLYVLSKGKYRISPTDLSSINGDKPLNQEVLDLLKSKEYQKIFAFFEKTVKFFSIGNPTGVLVDCKQYAEEHGTVHTRTVKFTDEFGQADEKEVFDWYEQDDPKEYRLIFYDHASLVTTEKGQSQREAMAKLSENFVFLRNRYGYSPVLIQQQAMFENIDAYKMDMLKPTIANLADNKAIARDVDCCLSMFSPYKYGLPSYTINKQTYDITVLKDNIRFMECLLNRHGLSNGVLPLFFDGACNYFSQMPLATDTAGMQGVYNHISKIKSNNSGILFFRFGVKNKLNNGKNCITYREEPGDEL